jgi:vitamin B12 transporter
MAPPINVAGYYTLDVVGEYAFTKQLKLFANLYNVTNQQYFDIRGYNSKRFNCMAGARFAF